MMRRCLARLGAAAARPGARSLGAQLHAGLVEAPLPLGVPTHLSRGLHRLASGGNHTQTCGCGCRGSLVTVQQQRCAPAASWRGRPFATEAKAAGEAGAREGEDPSPASEAGGGEGEGEGEGPSVEVLLQQLGEREMQLEDSVKQVRVLQEAVFAYSPLLLRDSPRRESHRTSSGTFATPSHAHATPIAASAGRAQGQGVACPRGHGEPA